MAAQARAAGVRVWGGYLATRPGVNLASPWDLASFDVARQVGGAPVAFCSGWDDPGACRNLAAQWNVRLCLDVEDRIRGDGPWVQPWLDASGAGLYGQHYQDTAGVWHSIHLDRRAAFHVMSWYIGRDPGASWAGPTPADGSALAWQWVGTHTEFGLSVDRGWYDDSFGGAFAGSALGGTAVTGGEKLAWVRVAYNAFLWRVPSPGEESQWAGSISDDGGNLDGVLAQIEDSAEGNVVKDVRQKLMGYVAANAFPGTPGPPGPAGPPTGPHTHGFQGTTGQT